MRSAFIILGICLIMTNALPAEAAGFAKVGTFGFSWEGIFNSARLSALGGSDLADGTPAAVMINPAPLSRENGFEFSYDHADYIIGLEFRTIAGSAEWKCWRLNIAVQEMTLDDMVIRTAYNPEGNGETFDMLSRMTVTGISYDLGRGLSLHPSLRWSIGSAWRHYHSRFIDSTQKEISLDLGSTLGWTFRYDGGWTAITGAVSWQNVWDKTIIYDETPATLPRPRRAGLTVETAWNWTGHHRHLVKILFSHHEREELGFTTINFSKHTGFEAVVFDVLALRWGKSGRVVGDIDSFGVGLTLDEIIPGPFTLSADLGTMNYNNILATDDKTIWGLRVGYLF